MDFEWFGLFAMQTLSRCVNRRRTPVGRYSSLFTTRLYQSESCWGRVARSVFAVSCRQDVSVVGSREAEWWGGGGFRCRVAGVSRGRSSCRAGAELLRSRRFESNSLSTYDQFAGGVWSAKSEVRPAS